MSLTRTLPLWRYLTHPLIASSQGNKHNAPFYILADEFNKYYQQYGIENSVLGMIKGWTLRLPILVKGLLKGYIPLEINHKWTIMPASFLIDKEGVIQRAYYGKDEGDHLPFDDVKRFSLNGKI